MWPDWSPLVLVNATMPERQGVMEAPSATRGAWRPCPGGDEAQRVGAARHHLRAPGPVRPEHPPEHPPGRDCAVVAEILRQAAQNPLNSTCTIT